MLQRFSITLKTEDYSKIPLIKAIRNMTGMELAPAKDIADDVIACGVNAPYEFNLYINCDDADMHNALSSINRNGYNIKQLDDSLYVKLADLLATSAQRNDEEAFHAIEKTLAYYAEVNKADKR